MEDADIQITLDYIAYIAHQWRALRLDQWAEHEGEKWPIGVWICLHEPLQVGANKIETPLSMTWFLDSQGMRETDPMMFMRFWTVQIQRPWATGGWTVPAQADFTRPRYRIGVVAFAPYHGTDEIYLEVTWGGTWARGQRIAVRDGQVDILGDLWMA